MINLIGAYTKKYDEERAYMDYAGSNYGVAAYATVEIEGKFYIFNGEYANQVNFCPFTGKKAPKQIGD